ncbi:MAG TPA: tRNA (adenosine(37)-N6)-dimethylallyltransferase MiaA [Anaerolineae bacterium]|nr:tRNA (adenosine(37)-N6)-dimethylallyltransferase MiaA [Anaerolineae bacterium]
MASVERPPLVTIVGPTGVGKTRLSIALCRAVAGEIVSADSRQVYKGMDIGTDKPTPEQRSLVPHHLVDIVSPDEEFTLAQYQRLAYLAIDDIVHREKVPFLVGGTGLYNRAVLEGFVIPRVEPDPRLRQSLRQQAESEGGESLHARLQRVDPAAAANIHPRNVRRVIRALEVYETLGEPISALRNHKPPSYRVLKVGLTMERKRLYQEIDDRVDRMVERGLMAEVQGLVRRGCGPELPAMSGLGYRQICAHLCGETDLATAVRQIKSETHRFVRQQYKWFRLDDQTIHWFDVAAAPQEGIEAIIKGFLEESQ